MAKLRFPENFFWGVATSSHQVEGGNRNNWTEWEKRNARRLAHEAKSKYGETSIWSKIKNKAAKPDNYISGKACCHHTMYEEDFDLMQSLEINSYRFSIEWSRVQPEKGIFNEEALKHYEKVIDALLRRNITPFVTLWHTALPIWVENEKGWESPKTIGYFCRYAEKVAERMKGKVKFWITINEPMVYAAASYLKGVWPPQKKSPLSSLNVVKNIISAQKKVFRILKKTDRSSKIGVANHLLHFNKLDDTLVSSLLELILGKWLWNDYFISKTKDYVDFIGVNYYDCFNIKYGFIDHEISRFMQLRWNPHPDGIKEVLRSLKKYNKPIYITENGFIQLGGKSKDTARVEYIKKIIKSISESIKDGSDIRGYFYWSLFDNFEWEKGFWPTLGLVSIDYANMKRKKRLSAMEYSKIIKSAKEK